MIPNPAIAAMMVFISIPLVYVLLAKYQIASVVIPMVMFVTIVHQHFTLKIINVILHVLLIALHVRNLGFVWSVRVHISGI